jgi:hypothetical protein
MDTVGMFEKIIKLFIVMYPLHVNEASEIDRNDLLGYKEKKINKRVPLVLTYHPSLENIAWHCPSSLERN